VTNPRRSDEANRRGERRTTTGGKHVVLKIGGELLETRVEMSAVARVIARAGRRVKLVVVHGGGKEIDAALAQASIPKHQVDGLRITDERTLHVVVSVLAGSINTRFVAAINAAGGRAVGLTAADAALGHVRPAKPHRATNGELVDLGLVGEPILGTGAPLVDALTRNGFLPVVASIGAAKDGRLFNVNADTLAASLAARVKAARLIFAGGTAGVLDSASETIADLSADAIDDLVGSGTVTAGMVAKLRACRLALEAGVREVAIADGRGPRLAALVSGTAPLGGAWTRVS
jgi:acetylglutamate kinase